MKGFTYLVGRAFWHVRKVDAGTWFLLLFCAFCMVLGAALV